MRRDSHFWYVIPPLVELNEGAFRVEIGEIGAPRRFLSSGIRHSSALGERRTLVRLSPRQAMSGMDMTLTISASHRRTLCR